MTDETLEKLKAEKDARISELEKELSETRTELEAKKEEHDIFVKKMARDEIDHRKTFAVRESNPVTF